MGALRAGEGTAGGISQKLGLEQGRVAAHLETLSKQGIVSLDGTQARIAMAA
jgi:predicted ArsR family transcriptional regulator